MEQTQSDKPQSGIKIALGILAFMVGLTALLLILKLLIG